MYRNGINMRVCVNGRPVREYTKDGAIFIESRHGTNYSIKVTNDNAYRIMAVVSVDGLDVIRGKPAEEADTGYVVDGYSSTEIKGYRVSDTESAIFTFSSKGESYTKEVEGNARNCGVVGIRAFREKELPQTVVWKQIINQPYPVPSPYPVYPDPWSPWKNPVWCGSGEILRGGGTYSDSKVTTKGGGQIKGRDSSVRCMMHRVSNSNAFDAEQKPSQLFDTGTSWGDQQHDKVKRVQFERGELVNEMAIYYSSHRALEKMGIDLTDTPSVTDSLPKPFGGNNYCTPPKHWKSNRRS